MNSQPDSDSEVNVLQTIPEEPEDGKSCFLLDLLLVGALNLEYLQNVTSDPNNYRTFSADLTGGLSHRISEISLSEIQSVYPDVESLTPSSPPSPPDLQLTRPTPSRSQSPSESGSESESSGEGEQCE